MIAAVEKKLKYAGDFGLFACEPLRVGTVIVPDWHDSFEGDHRWEILTVDEIMSLPPKRHDLYRKYGLDVDFGKIAGPMDESALTDPENFINHSCRPSLCYDTEGNVICSRNIAAGEELTVDYGCFSVNFDEEFTCRCGSTDCRRQVTKFDWINLSRQCGFAMPQFLHLSIRRLNLA